MGYNLDALGWLQFERLCDHALGVERTLWRGSADEMRVAVVDDGLYLPLGIGHVPGPLAVAAIWVRPLSNPGLFAQNVRTLLDLAPRTVILTNAKGHSGYPRYLLGADWLGELLDAEPPLRLRVPSALGVRPVGDLDPDGHALARVFAPTRAYDRAVDVLERHHFAVLTGPPEMGKTAIARTIGLALASDGWEVHDCTAPADVLRVAAAGARQLFVADDAFGSTEYRADAAERWARELPAILRLVDDRHRLIWTSRPAPLRAGLHRVHQERGTERFPSPAQVQVDAGALDSDEKASILFRHAKAAGLDANARTLVRSRAEFIVAHPHFTPERIRRFVADRLPGLDGKAIDEAVERELATPTAAMAASLAALEPEHRDLLVALLDTPPGPASERELAASLRRHHRGGLSHAPPDLIDRLADHFVKVLA